MGRTIPTVSHTEAVILSQGFGMPVYGHLRSVGELADRLEVSAFSLAPHLRSLLAKGELEAVGDERYRRRAV